MRGSPGSISVGAGAGTGTQDGAGIAFAVVETLQAQDSAGLAGDTYWCARCECAGSGFNGREAREGSRDAAACPCDCDAIVVVAVQHGRSGDGVATQGGSEATIGCA